jgi:autotransporter-associated beta strand protein
MKTPTHNRFFSALAIIFASFPVAVQADTITANAAARILAVNGNASDQGALSLYNEGVNVQRSWLNFDLSAYSGKAMVGDVTLTLQAGIFGNSLTGVQLGSANSAWSASGVTWNNQPGLTMVPGVTNPSGTFGSGPVTWTIPGYAVEKWATLGYNGIGMISGSGSSQHFYSLADGNSANHPKLTLTSADGANGTWTGGSGNWTDVANWDANTVAQGIDRTATINAALAVMVTMDASRSIGDLVFSGANHSISAGAGQLGLVKSTGTPSISVAGGTSVTIAGNVAGMDGLEKLGGGTLAFSGSANYLGSTTVSAGQLMLGGSSTLPVAGPITIGSGALLSHDATAGSSFHIGALTLTGGTLAATATPHPNLGNFHLKGTVTVSGTTPSTISADVRVIQNDNREFNVADDASGVDLLISGRLGHYNGNSWGYATKTGAGTMKLTAVPEIGGITVNAGKLILEEAGANWGVHESSNGGLRNFSEVELSVNSGSRSMSVPITGTGSLTKTGAGSAAHTGTTAHSGGTTVLQGTLSLGNGTSPTNLNDFAAVAIASGAVMDLNFSGTETVGSLSLGGTSMGSGVFNATTHPTYFTGRGSLLVVAPNSGVWASASNGNWEAFANWQSNIIASGVGNTATFNGAAGTTITLQTNRNIGNLDFSVENYSINSGGGTLTLANTSNIPSVTVASGRTAVIQTALTGADGLDKRGAGTLSLTSNGMSGSPVNTLSGHTIVSAGILEIYARSADNGGYTSIGTGPVTIESGATLISANDWTTGNEWNGGNVGIITINNGGTWTINAAGGTVRNGLILNGGMVNGPGSNAHWGGLYLRSTYVSAEGNAVSTISVDTAINSMTNMFVEAGSQLNYSGTIHNKFQSDGGITKSGGGILVLSAANSYTADTSVLEGSLILGNGSYPSNLADGADLLVATGATVQLNFSGNDTIDELMLGGVAKSPGTYNSANSGGFITGTGSLVVINGPAPTDPLLAWIDATWPTLEDKSPNGDPDNDGIENLLEYVLMDGDPSSSNPGILPTISASGENLIFTFLRRSAATEVTQTFQYGSDLSGWTNVPLVPGGMVAITSPESGIEQVVVTVPKGSNALLFGRIQIVK